MKVIFLDIDGVLNGHEYDRAAQSNTIRRDCVERFNRVLTATGAKVVLSSAWRYMVSGGAMTLAGFGYMLRTHGVAGCDIVGMTVPDETIPLRDDQIMAWVKAHPEVTAWVVLDDLHMPELPTGHVVETDGDKGLTDADAATVIDLLNASGWSCLPAPIAATILTHTPGGRAARPSHAPAPL